MTLVDLDDEKVARGIEHHREDARRTASQRGIFTPPEAAAILARITGTSRFEDLGDVDLLVEAVFEDLDMKKTFSAASTRSADPTRSSRPTRLPTRSRELASATTRPQRVVGLHYFYHPAKNRLVEVISVRRPIRPPIGARGGFRRRSARPRSSRAMRHGFIVNRFFVPWLTEAVRILEEGAATSPRSRQPRRRPSAIGMGPFELMNVTGHADRVSRGDDARQGARAVVRAAGAPPRADGIGQSRGSSTGTPDAGAVHERRRSAGHRCVFTSRPRSSTRRSARSKTSTSARASGCGGGAARSS